MKTYANYIKEMVSLKKGWNSYDADPPNALSIQNAQTMLDILKHTGIEPRRVAPVADGGIAIWLDLIPIMCYNSGEITIELGEDKEEKNESTGK